MPTSQNTNFDVTVVILAGGGSRRMQGRDKGLLPLQGKPLISHVIERIAPQTRKLVLNCNEHCANYARFGYPLLTDSLPGGLGPLAGLLSAMENSGSKYVLSVPCDTPYLPEDLVSRMFASLKQHCAEVCTVDDGQRLHPSILLVSCNLATDLKNYLITGGRKVHDWYERQHHCVADFSGQPGAFANINTPEQLRAEEDS
jgi:molybdenum cofactor guanylyltransferase